MVVGFIDDYAGNKVTGWAWDADQRSPLLIRALLDETELGRGVANQFRPDLASVSGDGRCSFTVTLSRALSEAETRRLIVTAGGTPLRWAGASRFASPSEREPNVPIPPDDLIWLVSSHRDRKRFASQRRQTANLIANYLGQSGYPIERFNSILDFGCGCGRILAGWQDRLSPGTKLYGVDINKDLIAFCQANIPFASTAVSDYEPPLPFRDGSLDLIYAASVFTHLTESAASAWGREFSRLIRPGGVAFVSYHGSYFVPEVARLNKAGVEILEERGIYVHVHGEEGSIWKGHNNYATFLTTWYLSKVIFERFKLVKVFSSLTRGSTTFAAEQDIAVLERR